jgi:ubiquinone/menaquinone biosynthesis C-methylase UbiE
MDLSYREQQGKLQTRIRAHKEFANFDVADWLDGFLARRERKQVLDLGCGNGNHLGLYLSHVGAAGTVTGIDRAEALIGEARERYRDATNLTLLVGSMDEPLPFRDGQFDTCFSNFAIYNAADPRATLTELRRVMSHGGELVLIGPTRNNAREIYEYNERLTGEAIDEITLIRTDRLRQEIEPIAREVFGAVDAEVLESRLTFPDRDEFVRYFKATMLYEQIAEQRNLSETQMLAACDSDHDVVLSKEMLALVARP